MLLHSPITSGVKLDSQNFLFITNPDQKFMEEKPSVVVPAQYRNG